MDIHYLPKRKRNRELRFPLSEHETRETVRLCSQISASLAARLVEALVAMERERRDRFHVAAEYIVVRPFILCEELFVQTEHVSGPEFHRMHLLRPMLDAGWLEPVKVEKGGKRA